MTPRQRYIETLTFGSPDRIPLIPGNPRESTLANWQRQGMRDDVAWDVQVIDQLGLDCDRLTRPGDRLQIDFNLRPQFEEKEIERREGSIVVQDWKGNICEISDRFDVTYLRSARDFVTRSWIRCPVETRDDWLEMRRRYDAGDPGRFPPDFARLGASLAERDQVLKVIVSGPFWIMREWCGFEGLCMLMIDQPDLVAEMAGFYRGFITAMFARMLEHVVPDHVQFAEDMAYKEKAMISPAMTREFCQPCWDAWTTQLKTAGVPLVEIDSDGYVGGLIPIWIESGVHVSSPVEVAAGNDINAFRAEFGRDQAFLGGVDKRAMAAGGRKLAAEIRRIEPVVRSGGYIPGCDHGVPSDVSWPSFLEHTRLLAGISGWL